MTIAAKDNNFVKSILSDITAINLTNQEIAKITAFIRTETGTAPLFTYINSIYAFIGANFKNPGKFIIIPFLDEKNMQHLNIQRIS